MIIDFRKTKNVIHSLEINHQIVEQVDFFLFLGLTVTNKLRWDIHRSMIVKKAQQHLYFLRELKKFGVSQKVLTRFYRAIIESVLTFSITVCYSIATQWDKESLDRIVKVATKLIGCDIPSMESLYSVRLIHKSNKIIADGTHPAHNIFQLLPSGKYFRFLKCRTNRYKKQFSS